MPKEKVQPKQLGKVIKHNLSEDGKDELIVYGSIFKERPQVQVMTWRKGQEDEHTMETPYYGRYGWDLNFIGDGKFAYEVFYDDVFGGIARADNMEDAIKVAIENKDSKLYFFDTQATIKVQRVKSSEDRIYDTQGVITNAKPRKSATLVK